MEKQKIKFSYGLRESQMQKIFSKAAASSAMTGDMILQILERRLDNVVFRIGFAVSRAIARQLVGHGHITVNGRKVTIPSYAVKAGDIVGIRSFSKDHPLLKEIPEALKKVDPPVWLAIDPEKIEGKVVALPKDFEPLFDVNLVVDYYSK